MAVVTKRARRIGSMMGVCRQICLVLLMATKTRLVSLHPFFELLVWVALMHRMASHAGQFALLVTRALNQAVKFAPGDADHSVWPKEIVQDVRVLGEDIVQPGLLG